MAQIVVRGSIKNNVITPVKTHGEKTNYVP
jgi:hypothetical protein